MKPKVRIGYIVNALLLIVMVFIGISGLFISKTIFTGISSNNIIWKVGHMAAGGFAIILIGIHLGLHWPFAVANMQEGGAPHREGGLQKKRRKRR